MRRDVSMIEISLAIDIDESEVGSTDACNHFLVLYDLRTEVVRRFLLHFIEFYLARESVLLVGEHHLPNALLFQRSNQTTAVQFLSNQC